MTNENRLSAPSLIIGAHKNFKFGKYANQYLGAFAYRFNWRFDLRALLTGLIGHASTNSPTRERQIGVRLRFMTNQANRKVKNPILKGAQKFLTMDLQPAKAPTASSSLFSKSSWL